MKNVYLGHTQEGKEINLDFDKEKIKFILLIGKTGSGKSVFHNNLYKQLMENYSKDELGFIIFDNTRIEFSSLRSGYLDKPVVNDPREALKILSGIPDMKLAKKLFIHIEECDMVNLDRMAVEAAFEKIKGLNDIYVIYSTSRIDRSYLGDWMKRFIDLKVVFSVPTQDDSSFLIGNDAANSFSNPGERILAFNDQEILCRSFSKKEIVSVV